MGISKIVPELLFFFCILQIPNSVLEQFKELSYFLKSLQFDIYFDFPQQILC